MINNVTQIASPYTKTATKVNDSSTLNASEWNAISDAVETAHAKINALAGQSSVGEVEIKAGQTLKLCGEDSVEIRSGAQGLNGGDILIGNDNASGTLKSTEAITLRGDEEIYIESTGAGIEITANNEGISADPDENYIYLNAADIQFIVGADVVSFSDLLALKLEWDYFKNNNSSLDFQSAA